MKLTKVKTEVTELDMTPMIDMTFQLIAFFMMLINFAEGDQNERIQLPASELAKPAVSPLESPITLHVTDDDSVIIGGQEISVDGLKPFLDREASVLTMRGKSPAVAAMIRGKLEGEFGPEYELLLNLMALVRRQVVAGSHSQAERKNIYKKILHDDIVEWIRRGKVDLVRAHLQSVLGPEMEVDINALNLDIA